MHVNYFIITITHLWFKKMTEQIGNMKETPCLIFMETLQKKKKKTKCNHYGSLHLKLVLQILANVSKIRKNKKFKMLRGEKINCLFF